MPSAELRLISLCAYLTDVSHQWRTEDHKASKMVKALKGKEFGGYFDHQIAGRVERFNKENAHQFVERIPRALAIQIARHLDENATLVPIPNSHVVAPTTPNFKTLELARAIAKHSKGSLVAVPAIVFRRPQRKSSEGGSRDPRHFEQEYRVLRDVKGSIVLVDDVCTTGAHLVAAHWLLHRPPESAVALACAFGRTTWDQLPNPVGLRAEKLSVERT